MVHRQPQEPLVKMPTTFEPSEECWLRTVLVELAAGLESGEMVENVQLAITKLGPYVDLN